MEALSSSETSVLTTTTQRNIPEDGILDFYRYKYSNKALGFVTSLRDEVLIPVGANFFCSQNPQTASLFPPPASYYIGADGYFLGIEDPGREADHSLQPSVEIKNGGPEPLLVLLVLISAGDCVDIRALNRQKRVDRLR
jgi:hypothetical protein